MHISGHVKESNGNSCQTWIVPGWLNPLDYINNLLGLEWDRTPVLVEETNERKANVNFVQTIVPESLLNLKRRNKLGARTLQNIGREEELFVDYRSS